MEADGHEDVSLTNWGARWGRSPPLGLGAWRRVAAHDGGTLTQIDLSPAGQPISLNPNHVWTLGQGVWIGYGDTMRVGDIDDDGKIEVVFPNLDGFVHVLELDGTGTDIKLRDEWRSPYLGPMCCAFAGFGTPPNAYMYVGDATGTVHKIQVQGNNTYALQSPLVPRPSPPYDGPIQQIVVSNFGAGGGGAKQIAVQNWQYDWNIYKQDGTLPVNATQLRGTHSVQPGIVEAWDSNGDGKAELWIPALDGFLWQLDVSGTGPQLTAKSSFLNYALYRVVPVSFGAPGSTPTHYLLLARNDDRTLSGLSPNVILLLDASNMSNPPVEVSASINTNFSAPVCFSWMVKPAQGGSFATFAIGSQHQIEVFQLNNPGGAVTLAATGVMRTFVQAQQTVGPPAPRGDPDMITSVKSASAAGQQVLFVAFADGRIMPLDFNLLTIRHSNQEFLGDPDVPSGATPTDWYSNRTFGHLMPTDVWPRPGNPTVLGADGIHFAEYFAPFVMENNSTKATYRHGRLVIGPSGNPSWDAYFDAAAHFDRSDPSSLDVKAEPYIQFCRQFRVGDYDVNGSLDNHSFAEAGDLYRDSNSPAAVHEYCTQGVFPPAAPPTSALSLAGGFLFEYDPDVHDPNVNPINPLRVNQWTHVDFGIPNDYDASGQAIYESFPNGDSNNWFYPVLGTKLSGQICAHSSHGQTFQFGSSVRIAKLSDKSGNGVLVPHVVVGTFGGYVYGIQPGAHVPGPMNHTVDSDLNYASTDLGCSVMGLDVGELDGDLTDGDEVVAGTWFDTGGRPDWDPSIPGHPDLTKNRAHIHILKAPVSGFPPRMFSELARLDGDAYCGGAGLGIGSGVTGVKIDDVNADGLNEIWAGDAVGHIYLFRRHTTTSPAWDCIHRSDDLGAYVGRYNGIYPIKDSSGHTVRLVVMTAGYVYAFGVAWDQVWGPP